MPIKPENKHHYGVEWTVIREQILVRAGNRCELCNLHNQWWVCRDADRPGNCFSFEHREIAEKMAVRYRPSVVRKWRAPVRVVLTIAHINQDPGDNRKANLLALCQRCHNRIDLPYRLLNRRTQ